MAEQGISLILRSLCAACFLCIQLTTSFCQHFMHLSTPFSRSLVHNPATLAARRGFAASGSKRSVQVGGFSSSSLMTAVVPARFRWPAAFLAASTPASSAYSVSRRLGEIKQVDTHGLTPVVLCGQLIGKKFHDTGDYTPSLQDICAVYITRIL